jgi:hypothetical protein
MHFTYRCRYLNCSVQRAVWVGGWGEGLVALRNKFILYRTAGGGVGGGGRLEPTR